MNRDHLDTLAAEAFFSQVAEHNPQALQYAAVFTSTFHDTLHKKERSVLRRLQNRGLTNNRSAIHHILRLIPKSASSKFRLKKNRPLDQQVQLIAQGLARLFVGFHLVVTNPDQHADPNNNMITDNALRYEHALLKAHINICGLKKTDVNLHDPILNRFHQVATDMHVAHPHPAGSHIIAIAQYVCSIATHQLEAILQQQLIAA